MNRNATIVLAVIIVSGLVIGGAIILPLLTPPAMSTLVEFHDADGNLIDVPMAIAADGQEVTTMTVTVTWLVEAENIQEGTFAIDGVIAVGLIIQPTSEVNPLDTFTFASTAMSGYRSHTWILADLLPMSDQDIGWILEIKACIGASGTDLDGNPISTYTTTTPIIATLEWVAPTATLNIVECTVTKTYP